MERNTAKSLSRLIALATLAFVIVGLCSSARAFELSDILKNKETDNFKIIGVADLTKLMNDPASHVNIYDANGDGLRSTAGVIPGAHLLTSDNNYNVATELPPNKGALLVFYCADRH
ncbi:MAG TPA: hypothetical protein VMA09_10745 [Candidatus Binataceae bacterium]|nr:hypothetical protein [Candidatus Binataceae bacterium]